MKKLVSFALCLLLGAAFLLCGCDKQANCAMSRSMR